MIESSQPVCQKALAFQTSAVGNFSAPVLRSDRSIVTRHVHSLLRTSTSHPPQSRGSNLKKKATIETSMRPFWVPKDCDLSSTTDNLGDNFGDSFGPAWLLPTLTDQSVSNRPATPGHIFIIIVTESMTRRFARESRGDVKAASASSLSLTYDLHLCEH
jgi:hypothetical protein